MNPNFNLKREISNKLTCGISEHANTPFHFHSQIEIYLVLSGQIEVIVNDKRKILTPGELSVAFSYDAHGYRNVKDSRAIYLIIPTDLCGEFLPELNKRSSGSPFINDAGTVKTVSDAMHALLRGGNDISKRGYIYTILGALLDQMPEGGQSQPKGYGFSPDMLIFISHKFRDELTLDTVAKEFGYNPSYLSRAFRETFGISFVKYLTMLRLREAVLLLRSGDRSVTECAMESGFGSMRSFYRAFREEFGASPKKLFEEYKSKK